MAVADVAADVAEIADALTLEEIPIKLRCAGCNKIAINAFRMPCCDQSLCETCQAALDTNCPVCLHEPVQKQDCRPNKALRITTKAFLKRKLIERDAAAKKKAKALLEQQTPATSVVAEVERVPEDGPSASQDVDGPPRDDEQKPTPSLGESQDQSGLAATIGEVAIDVPEPSIETPNQERRASVQSLSKGGKISVEPTIDEQPLPGSNSATRSTAKSEQPFAGTPNVQSNVNGVSPFEGMPGAQTGLMNGMDYSQMMQMMPNGMQPNMMGAFPPFMGMPPIGLDPMSAMYAGFGGQGMGMGMNGMTGMNGMNMGMGFNAGQAAYNGFNGQNEAWNAGQNNYYPNAYANANGMGGDFGAQSGYSGYNVPSHQGNFNQMNNHQQFSHNDYQSGYHGQGYPGRGRGRGRRGGYEYQGRGDYSGRGRGNYNHAQGHGYQNSLSNQGNYEAPNHQIPPQSQQNPTTGAVHSDRVSQIGHDAGSKDTYYNQPPETAESAQAAQEKMDLELAPGDADDDDRPPLRAREPLPTAADIAATQGIVQVPTPPEAESGIPAEATQVAAEPKEEKKEPDPIVENAKPAPIETFISTDNDQQSRYPTQSAQDRPAPDSAAMPPPTAPLGPAIQYSQESFLESAGRGRGYSRGYRGSPEVARPYRGRGGPYLPNGTGSHVSQNSFSLTNGISSHVPAAEPKGVGVEGAPTGPKALREATSASANKGGRGFSIVGRAAAARTKSISTARSRSPSPVRARSRTRTPSPPHHHHSSRHRSQRDRSRTPEDDSSRHHKKRSKHRSRHHHEADDDDTTPTHKESESRRRDRSTSSSTTHRSSHRRRHHRRERSRDRDSERERDRERRHHRRHSPSHPASIAPTPTSAHTPTIPNVFDSAAARPERDSDSKKRRSTHDEHEDERYAARKRSRHELDPPSRPRKHSTRDSAPATPLSASHPNFPSKVAPPAPARPSEQLFQPPKGPRASRMRGSAAAVGPLVEGSSGSGMGTGTRAKGGVEKDHHTLEREARNRERMMKEMQRRQAVGDVTGPAKGKGSAAREGILVRGRSVNVKYEDEMEGGRWG